MPTHFAEKKLLSSHHSCTFSSFLLLTLLSIVRTMSCPINSNLCRLLRLGNYPGYVIFPPSQQYLYGHHQVMSLLSQLGPWDSLKYTLYSQSGLARLTVSLWILSFLTQLGPRLTLSTLFLPVLCIYFDPLLKLSSWDSSCRSTQPFPHWFLVILNTSGPQMSSGHPWRSLKLFQGSVR